MSEQHLHNKLGNAIGECKSRMYQRLKADLDLRSAIALFMQELQTEFREIVEETESADEEIQAPNLIS